MKEFIPLLGKIPPLTSLFYYYELGVKRRRNDWVTDDEGANFIALFGRGPFLQLRLRSPHPRWSSIDSEYLCKENGESITTAEELLKLYRKEPWCEVYRSSLMRRGGILAPVVSLFYKEICLSQDESLFRALFQDNLLYERLGRGSSQAWSPVRHPEMLLPVVQIWHEENGWEEIYREQEQDL